MSQFTSSLYRSAVIITLILALSLGVTHDASAQGIITDGRIPAGEVVENDAIIYGDNVVVDGSVDGDLIAVGSMVTINGDIGGSLFAFGGTVTVNGEVSGSLYSIAREIELGSTSNVGRSVYFLGFRMATLEGSSIGRDLVGLSLRAQLSGSVGRDIRAVFGLLEFIGIIADGIESETPEQESEPTPSSETDADESGQAKLGNILAYFSPVVERSVRTTPVRDSIRQVSLQDSGSGTQQADDILPWLQDRLAEFVTYLVVGLAILWLLPKKIARWTERGRTAPFVTSGYGLIGLVIAVNGFVLVLLLAAIILVIGLALGYATLWDLAIIFWGIGYSSLGLGLSVFALFVFYGSKIIVAYLVGVLIVKRISQKALHHRVLVLCLGLLIFVLLSAIPYFGWVISVLVTMFGLGSILLVFRDDHFPPRKEAAELDEDVTSEHKTEEIEPSVEDSITEDSAVEVHADQPGVEDNSIEKG